LKGKSNHENQRLCLLLRLQYRGHGGRGGGGWVVPAISRRKGGRKVETFELVVEMKLLERRLTLYEEKYGLLSQDFYDALMSGKLEPFDAYDETRIDFIRWKGIYETWQRRKAAYEAQIANQDLVSMMRLQPAY
jgi:hypothetical protein